MEMPRHNEKVQQCNYLVKKVLELSDNFTEMVQKCHVFYESRISLGRWLRFAETHFLEAREVRPFIVNQLINLGIVKRGV